MSVDLPAPEGPSSTSVPPGGRWPSSSSRPSPFSAEVVTTSTPADWRTTVAHDVVREVREVRLRDDHERRGTGVPGRDQRPFEPVVRERTVHRNDDPDDVHVGAKDLRLGGGLEGTLAAQLRVARQDAHDGGLPRRVRAQPDPVPGGGKLPAARVGQVGGSVAVGHQDEVAVHPDDAAGAVAARHGMGREPLRDAGRVAVVGRTLGASRHRRARRMGPAVSGRDE